MSKEIKQWILVRKDLGMRKGKMIAQGAHASVGAVLSLQGTKDAKVITKWIEQGMTKIALGMDSEEQMLELSMECIKRRLPYYAVKDAGRTEFKEPTWTALAIGPCTVQEAQALVGSLKLL